MTNLLSIRFRFTVLWNWINHPDELCAADWHAGGTSPATHYLFCLNNKLGFYLLPGERLPFHLHPISYLNKRTVLIKDPWLSALIGFYMCWQPICGTISVIACTVYSSRMYKHLLLCRNTVHRAGFYFSFHIGLDSLLDLQFYKCASPWNI